MFNGRFSFTIFSFPLALMNSSFVYFSFPFSQLIGNWEEQSILDLDTPEAVCGKFPMCFILF
jgi:hypothetical protein